jgi:hypothetical protein
MIDPTSASRDRLQDTGRWGYAGDSDQDHDPVPVEEAGGIGRWLPWIVLLVIAAVVVAFLAGLPA